MAAPGRDFINALRRYGASSSENKAKLEAWRTAAITAIAENNGGQIVSGTTNGISFAQVASMTNAEWFTALDQALVLIDAGISLPSRTVARIV